MSTTALRSPERTDWTPGPLALTSEAPTALPPTGKKPRVEPVCSAINCARICKADAWGCAIAADPIKTALLEPDSKLSAIFWARSDIETFGVPAGAVTDFALATAKAISLNVLIHALGAATIPIAGINQSSPPASTRMTCKLRFAAVRILADKMG